MELGETCEEGAIRETREETGARVRIRDLLGIYSLPHIGQVHLIYRAHMLAPDLDVGPECHEARLVRPAEIPWKDLAFSTNRWALEHFLRAEEVVGPLPPFTEPPPSA
jgi:ADP-ribose pyrophosphatase YjhB (NUDIX family)